MNVKPKSGEPVALFADVALTPAGWRENVRVRIGAGGRIDAVETGARPGRDDRRLARRALLPAPGNLHSHAFQRALAGLAERRGPTGRDSFWTWREEMYALAGALSPGLIEIIAALAYVEMLEAGYASVGEFHYLHHAPGGDHYDNLAETSLSILAAAGETGIGLTHLPVFYVRGGADGRPLAGGQLRFGCDLETFAALCDAAEAALADLPADVRLGVAPHSLRAVPPHMLPEIAATGDGPVHIHVAEQLAEVDEIRAAFGARPVELLLESADIDQRWCAVHATHMSPSETRALAASGATAGLCPVTEASLGDGIFNAPDFLARGGNFGIGTDSNILIDLAGELRTLEYSQRYRDRARAVIGTPERSVGRSLYEAALAGGSRALGRDAGAIKAGAWGDLLALDLAALPLAGRDGDTILDAWIFACRQNPVIDVWSAGRHVVRDGRHVGREAIEARYRDAIDRLRSAL